MRIAALAIVACASALSACNNAETEPSREANLNTEIHIEEPLPENMSSSGVIGNSEANLTDPTAGEEVEPALNAAVEMNGSGQ